MRIFAAVLTMSALALLSVASAASDPAPGAHNGHFLISWADRQHGWRLRGRVSSWGGYPLIQATENGGRTWRTIYRSPKSAAARVLRTSATAGIVQIGVRMAVTLDDGAHWTTLRKGLFWPYLNGEGTDLYFLTPGPHTGNLDVLHQVTNWPTTAPKTKVIATASGGAPGAYGSFGDLTMIPGGVALSEFEPARQRVALVVVLGATVTRHMTPKTPTPPGFVLCGQGLVSINWPRVVFNESYAPAVGTGACDNAGQNVVEHISDDGGAHWSTLGTADGARP